jgi:histidine phosphotransfer protein HptB
MIDWERVNQLREEVGTEDFAEIVALFLEEVDEVAARLTACPNPATYESDLHFLKGSALNIGFSDLAALCETGERAAAAGRADQVSIMPVIDCYARSRRVFEATLGRIAA